MLGLSGIVIPDTLAVYVTALVLVGIRLSLMLFMMPAVGDNGVSVRIRGALLMVLTITVAPIVVPAQIAVVGSQDIVKLAIFEGVIGFALAFTFRVTVYALTIAGTIMAQTMSLSQLFGGGATQEPNPSVSQLLTMAGAVLFVTLDFHTLALGLYVESFQAFPIGDIPSTGNLAEWAIERSVSAFALGVSLALPFILVNFAYNVVLGLINQAMPQMMVTFIGVPANVFAGILLLVIACTVILKVWMDQMSIAFTGFW